MTRRILALAAALAALPAAWAHAGDDAEAAKLRLLESMGRRAHQEERYADAIDAFEACYLMRQDPRYLYNIGRSHERNGDLGQAVDYLERYLAQVTDPKDRADAEAVLAVLRVKLARQAAGTGEPMPDAYPEPPPEEPPDEPGPWPSWAALSTLAAGGALLAGGTVFGVLAGRAEERRDGLKGAEPVPASRFIEEDDAARRDALVANVLLGTGGAAVVAGAVLLLLDLPGDAAQPALALVPLPGGLGVSVGVTR